jgi:molybdopterin-binding protein
VHLAVQGIALTAAVMAATVEELGLRPGAEVHVAVKATAIHLI